MDLIETLYSMFLILCFHIVFLLDFSMYKTERKSDEESNGSSIAMDDEVLIQSERHFGVSGHRDLRIDSDDHLKSRKMQCIASRWAFREFRMAGTWHFC